MGSKVSEHNRCKKLRSFNLRWSDVGVGSTEALPKHLGPIRVLISVGATLGWEGQRMMVCGTSKKIVLISVGATLGWEACRGYDLDHKLRVLISFGATLGWEVQERLAKTAQVRVLISVGATLGWEGRCEGRASGIIQSFNLRWSDVGVGRARR